jgi:hypothetical protein
MRNTSKTTSEVISRLEDTLYTAQLGLHHVKGADPRARTAGLRNVIVFGRAVTNVLQNLRPIQLGFDKWYQAKVVEMGNDPLMQFFYKLRSEILKEGSLHLTSSVTLNGNPMEIFRHFKAPPRAKGFFIGDTIGGSGWEIDTGNGTTEKYYVQLPEAMPGLRIELQVHLADAPEEFRRLPIEQLCERYLDYLTQLVSEAKDKFG